MVADDNVICFDGADNAGVLRGTAPRGLVYAAQRVQSEIEHDGRGLLIAITMCMSCWGVLGFILLR